MCAMCSGLVGRKKNGPRHRKTGPPFHVQEKLLAQKTVPQVSGASGVEEVDAFDQRWDRHRYFMT